MLGSVQLSSRYDDLPFGDTALRLGVRKLGRVVRRFGSLYPHHANAPPVLTPHEISNPALTCAKVAVVKTEKAITKNGNRKVRSFRYISVEFTNY